MLGQDPQTRPALRKPVIGPIAMAKAVPLARGVAVNEPFNAAAGQGHARDLAELQRAPPQAARWP